MATPESALGWLLVVLFMLGPPLVVAYCANCDDIWSWWEEWRENRGYRTYRFVVTAYPDDGTELTLPVWFEERDFNSAAHHAISLQESLFGSWILVGIKAVDRSWGYVREPEAWISDVESELLARIEELVGIMEEADDVELPLELAVLSRRLIFVAQSGASAEDMEGAWAIVEEDIAEAFERAETRGDGSEPRWP